MAIVPRKKKDGSESFQVKVQDPDGKWYPTPTFLTLEAAQTEEARLLKLKRKAARALSGEARNTTADEYWEVWSEDCRPKTSEGWKITQDQMWRDYGSPVIGKTLMSEITPPLIGRVFKRAEAGWKDRKGVGPQTRLNIYTMLHKMFSDAVEYYQMLATNPVMPKFHRPEVPKTERRFLEPEQARLLLETAIHHQYLGPAIWVQILAAMRPAEMIAIDWSAIQWDKGQILVCRGYKAKVGRIQDYPKGKNWEYVPLPPMLKAYLATEWERRGRPASGFVCQGIKGGMLPYETYLRALRRVCTLAGVPRVTPHELRHSSTELWVQQGASQEDIRRLLNHASLSATRRYLHRTNGRLNEIGSRLGNSMGFPNGKKEISAEQAAGGSRVH